MTGQATDTIVLVHGMWMTAHSWRNWIGYYEKLGWRVIAPPWPGAERDALREAPESVAGQGVGDIVEHYVELVAKMDRPPVLIGHSLGGAVVQVLLSRGLGAAGVAIASEPVRGVRRVPFTSLRASWPVLRNPANRKRAVGLTREQFRYMFTNAFADADADAAYEEEHVPASGRMMFQVAFANLNPRSPLRVDFRRRDRAPLLLIAGGADHMVPPSVSWENHRRYRRSGAATEFHEFFGRCHHTIGQPAWEDVADYALAWLRTHGIAGEG